MGVSRVRAGRDRGPEVARARGWRLVTALPGWPCRGLAGGGCPEKVAQKLVRAGPELQTNGFFIARFERRSTS